MYPSIKIFSIMINAAKFFDRLAYVIAGASYLHSTGAGFLGSSFRGIQGFAISSIFDKTARFFLAANTQKEPSSIHTTLFHPIIEEAIYSGVLLTQSKAWMIPRFAAALFTGMTAARALTGWVSPERNKQGLTPDTKIGFLWAISRELLLLSFPQSSIPLLFLDSSVFALAEVCPTKEQPALPKFSSAWSYKVLSSAFFRLTANTVAKTHGIVASIAQHLLFNISRNLQERVAGQAVRTLT